MSSSKRALASRTFAAGAPRALTAGVVLLSSLAAALSFGLNYGIDNQVVYFLSALRRADASVLANDWYAAHATHYHPVISALAAPLIQRWPSGAAIAALHMLVVTLGFASWYWVCRALSRHRLSALSVFALVLALLVGTRTLSAGTSYVFNEAFQPSALGSLGLLFAIAPLLAGRWLLSGMMLGLSGLFHANFLVLNIAVFGLAQLLIGGAPRALARRLLLQLGPSLIAFAVLVLPILATVASESAARAQQILFEIRSPHHYAPRAFQRDFVLLLGWSTLGLVGVRLVPESRAKRRLLRWLLATASVVWLGTLFTSWQYQLRVAQLFVWRLAPFLDLAMHTLGCAAVVHAARRPKLLSRLSLAEQSLALAAFLALASAYALRGNDRVTELVSLIALVGAGFVLVLRRFRGATARRRGWLGAGLCVACFGVFAWSASPPLWDLPRRSTLLSSVPAPEAELYAWVAQHTDPGARFLTPPEHQEFRFHARRAIVVDWKATPMVPEEVLEWFERLKDVTARPNFTSHRDLAGYHGLDRERVRRLDAKYGVDYVLVFARHARGLAGLTPVFRNGKYAVFDVRNTTRALP